MEIKHTKGRFLSLFICSILVLTILNAGVGVVAAADPIISIKPAVKEVNVGEDFSVFIEVDPNGNTVETALLDLTYDHTKVSITEVVMNGVDFPINSPGEVTVAGKITKIMGLNTAATGLETVANLAEIQMHADAAGTFTVGISGKLTKPPKGDPLTPVTMNSGEVRIEGTGDSLEVTVLYPNGGESIQIGTQVQVSARATDDSAVTSVTFYYSSGSNWNSIGAGTRVSGTAKDGTWDITWSTNGLSAGTNYKIKAVASDGTSTSEDQSNNKFSLTGTQPDLNIQDISWSPEYPEEGENITFCVKVKNKGTASTESCTVELNCSYHDYITIFAPLPPLAAGETATIQEFGTFAFEYGNFPLKATVDVYNDVRESDEENNVQIETMRITGLEEIKFKGTAIEKNVSATFYSGNFALCGEHTFSHIEIYSWNITLSNLTVWNALGVVNLSVVNVTAWNVTVDENISGPSELQQGHTIKVFLISDQYPQGDMDPSIELGDKIEVYGMYRADNSVALFGSVDYYLKKITQNWITIEVSPSTTELNVFDTQQFTATAKDQDGESIGGVDLAWTSSNTAVGTVSPSSATTGSDGTATTIFTASASGLTTVKASHEGVSGTATVTVQHTSFFDTLQSKNPYPSIPGTHTGTITPNKDITVQKLYTYPCAGTGGHTESVWIYGNGKDESTSRTGYAEDGHTITFDLPFTPPLPPPQPSEGVVTDTITFDSPFTLESGKTYYYVIETGSYPQIHHTKELQTEYGWLNCTKFTDANGKEYDDWIPAIQLFG